MRNIWLTLRRDSKKRLARLEGLQNLLSILDVDKLSVDSIFVCKGCWSYRNIDDSHLYECTNRYDPAAPLGRYKDLMFIIEEY